MKKILELAERYLNAEYWHTKVVSDEELEDCEIELDKAYNGLKEAIKVRKILEQTPITEDWLKEHGWEKDKGLLIFDTPNGKLVYQEPTLYHYAKTSIVDILGTFCDIRTLADLYDALELCNIQID